MLYYRYRAVNDFGKYVSGKMSAENPSDLATLLRKSNLDLVSFKEEKKSNLSFFSKIKPKDFIAIFVHLEQLEKAGVSIVDSISDLKENAENVKIKNLMGEIYESVKNGSLFSESMAKHSDIFGDTYSGLIATGEKTGNLSGAFASIIDDIKWNIDIKRKTKKAITGPAFGIIMMFVVLGVMTSVVVPKVTAFLKSQSIDLPFMTTSLINFSDFVKSYWLVILLTPIIAWITTKIVYKTSNNYAIKIDHFKLKIPIIGSILNKIDAAKFCQFFTMTFKSGLGILECLDSSSKVIKNKAMRNAIITIKNQVSDGQSLSKSIAMTGYFPSLVVRMFRVGEESGNMENALQNIKFFYDREINDSIDKIVGMIQPTLTIVMGGMIAWITIAVFGPIYGSFSKIK